jgi:hypothetical protein
MPMLPEGSRYWGRLIVRGQKIDLQHLDPYLLHCPTTDGQLPNPLLINVRYSDHCFSEKYDLAVHELDLLLPWSRSNSRDPRAFDRTRYSLSRVLPALVGTLPNVRVNFTTEQRNYVYAAIVQHPETPSGSVPYGVFFQLKRATTHSSAHLDLTVVSAYSPDRSIGVRKRPERIRFLLLATKTYRGERIQPPRR